MVKSSKNTEKYIPNPIEAAALKELGQPSWRFYESKEDFEKVVEYKNGVVQKLLKSLELMVKNAKIKVVNAEAKVVADGKVLADGEEYCCDEIVVATGSKPRVIKGLEYDHELFYHLMIF